MDERIHPGPLTDVRVLDLVDEKGAYCTKLLADLGADVIKVEPPGGDPTRRFGPFWRDTPDPDGSLFFWYHNTNKRSVVLDLDTPAGQAALRDLAVEADVMVETFPVGHLAARGLDHAALAARNPALIQTSITPFGQTGPRAGWAGNDLTAWAMSGVMLGCGDQGRPPLRGAGGQANILAAGYATVATLAALRHQRRTGEGQAIDISMQEAGVYHNEAGLLLYRYAGLFLPRVGRCQNALVAPWLAAPTKDGFCQMIAGTHGQWDAFVAWLEEAGLAGELNTPKWRPEELSKLVQLALANRPYIRERMETLAGRYTRDELFRAGQRRGLPFGPIQTPAEAAEDPELAVREYWAEGTGDRVQGPGSRVRGDGGGVRFPGAPYKFSETPWAILVSAPDLRVQGAGHRVWWRPRADPPPLPPEPSTLNPVPSTLSPLAGVRVLDLSWVVAGPFATMLLADLGAEVIKVEAPGTGEALRLLPPLDPRGSAPNHSSLWNVLNRGKKSITVDFTNPAGRDLVRRLALAADVVVENFRPGTLERVAGDPEEWRRDNPRLVVVRLSGFGQTGPRRGYVGYAATLHAISGFSYLMAYDETEPIGTASYHSDYIGGFTGAIAVLAALHHRDRTGRGQTVDVAQLEALIATLGPAFLDYAVNGRDPRPAGNRLVECPDAPQGAYPCRVPAPPAAGPPEREAWIAIAITSDDHWAGLRRALADPEWARDSAFATSTGRAAAADRIDAEIAAWTKDQDAHAAMALLQAHGVPAGVVQSPRDILERDEHLAARGYFVTIDHPEMGEYLTPGLGFRLSRTPAAIRGHAPLLSQHTEEILREVLGLGEEEITELILSGAV